MMELLVSRVILAQGPVRYVPRVNPRQPARSMVASSLQQTNHYHLFNSSFHQSAARLRHLCLLSLLTCCLYLFCTLLLKPSKSSGLPSCAGGNVSHRLVQ